MLRSVTIVLVTGRHSYDEVDSSVGDSATVVSAIPHGTVLVSLTRKRITVTEHDGVAVELVSCWLVLDEDDAFESEAVDGLDASDRGGLRILKVVDVDD